MRRKLLGRHEADRQYCLGKSASEGIIRVPQKTSLLKLCELNDLRVPIDGDIKPVCGRSSILKIDHVSSKTTTNRREIVLRSSSWSVTNGSVVPSFAAVAV